MNKFLVIALLLAATPALAQHKSHTKQTQPDKGRIMQIQDALVRQGRLPAVTGNWDKPTIAALRALAVEHGWSACHVPDARVLNILGLGSSTSGIGTPPELTGRNILASEQAKWEKQHPEDCHE